MYMYLCSNTAVYAVLLLFNSASSSYAHIHTHTQHNDIQQSSCRPIVMRWSQTLVILINHSSVVIRWRDDEKCSCQANMSLSQEVVVQSGKQLYPRTSLLSLQVRNGQKILYGVFGTIFLFSDSIFKDFFPIFLFSHGGFQLRYGAVGASRH